MDLLKIYEAWKMVSNANKPLILVGKGIRISNTLDELKSFVNETGISVVNTFLGKDCFIDSVGTIGIKGNETANKLLFNSDVLLVLGASLPIAQIGYTHQNFSARKLIVVNIEKPNCFIKPTLFIQVGLKEFFYEYNKFLQRIEFEP